MIFLDLQEPSLRKLIFKKYLNITDIKSKKGDMR